MSMHDFKQKKKVIIIAVWLPLYFDNTKEIRNTLVDTQTERDKDKDLMSVILFSYMYNHV